MGGYQKDIDYYYFSDCVIKQNPNCYEDLHKNRIISEESFQKLKFAFSGFDSIIEIGKNVNLCNTTIYMHNSSRMIIEDNTSLQDSIFNIGNGGAVKIGSGCKILQSNITCGGAVKIGSECNILQSNITCGGDIEIGNQCSILNSGIACENNSNFQIGYKGRFFCGKLVQRENSCFKIGNYFSTNLGCDFNVGVNTTIVIGEDCMFSYYVFLRTDDAHSIFDIKSGKKINSTYQICKNRNIVVGNHVWVGMRCTILYNTEIGDGSIIGAASLVKSKIPNNCIAAGIPAKVIRKDIAWSRDNRTDDIMTCGADYIHLTNTE